MLRSHHYSSCRGKKTSSAVRLASGISLEGRRESATPGGVGVMSFSRAPSRGGTRLYLTNAVTPPPSRPTALPHHHAAAGAVYQDSEQRISFIESESQFPLDPFPPSTCRKHGFVARLGKRGWCSPLGKFAKGGGGLLRRQAAPAKGVQNQQVTPQPVRARVLGKPHDATAFITWPGPIRSNGSRRYAPGNSARICNYSCYVCSR